MNGSGKTKPRTRIGIDGALIMAGLGLAAVLQALGTTTAAAAMLGLVAAGSWFNLLRYMKDWKELRRQILLESGALAFLISIALVMGFTAVSGVMDCDCSIPPLAVEGVMLGALVIASFTVWLRYR